MAIKRHRRGGRVYLSEYKQVREGKKVKSVFVRYLGPEDRLKAGEKPKRRVLDRLDLKRSYRAGDVRLLWRVAMDLGLVEIIDRICCQESRFEGPSPGKFLTVWAINRVVDPESCTQLENWVPSTDLPLLTGIDPELFTKDAFLSSLDFVCYHDLPSNRVVDHTATIDDTLYQRWRYDHPLPPGDRETVAYDLTSVLFYGVTCPLAELGYNTKGARRRQVNLALLVSKNDMYPVAHFIYNGNRNTASTVKDLLSRLKETAIKPGTIVWDRGNVSKDHVKMVESAGWKLICGVPKTSNEARAIIEATTVPMDPTTFIHKSRLGHIYAVKSQSPLFNKKRSVTVYINQEQRARDINVRNEALARIGEELNTLDNRGGGWSEARLHREIEAIIGPWRELVQVTVKRKRRMGRGEGHRIEWKYLKRRIAGLERSYGKHLLLSTDESLSAGEVVKTYFEKDFVEKVFRILKTVEDMEPVRHRLEHRVRAYMFVCVLAYRILSALRFLVAGAVGENKSSARTWELLRDLGRVERVDVGFGKEVRTWYLNKSRPAEAMLKKIGMRDLLKEETQLKV